MYSVEFAYNIVPSDEAGQGLSNLLIRQLAAIESGKGLQQAARSLGVSYRYFWGQIEIWEERFGQKLVIREQGKRARLSPLGQKLLWAERTVMAYYAVQMVKMRTELNAAFAAACNPDADIVTIAGCFDPWLATLPAFLFPSHLIADLQFSTSVSGLRALADEKCDFAGFNFPRGAGRESEAARTFAPLIDPEAMCLCRFASRTQGLAVAPGNPLRISSIRDVLRDGLQYAGRAVGTGTEVLLRDLCAQADLDPAGLHRVSTEVSHRAVAMAVAAGRADAGLCVENAARQAGADFLPLTVEDYFLAWRRESAPAHLDKVLSTLSSDEWRSTVVRFAGVSGINCGEPVDCRTEFGWWG